MLELALLTEHTLKISDTKALTNQRNSDTFKLDVSIINNKLITHILDNRNS